MKKENKEIIFQVRILRDKEGFELVKTELSNFEQTSLETFLKTYLQISEEERLLDFKDMIDYKED